MEYKNSDLDIVVVSNPHRPALVEEFLTSIPHITSVTSDYNLPENWQPNPQFKSLIWNQTGAYRCFKGHQDALSKTVRPVILVLEDDAVPNCIDWLNIVLRSINGLKEFELVSLHNRNITESAFEIIDIDSIKFYKPLPEHKGRIWGQGSLAYLIKSEDIGKITDADYDSYPMDLFILNRFNSCIIKHSPFEHDRRFPSLVEYPK